MARFYVGQRVRVVCPGSVHYGKETVIRNVRAELCVPHNGEYGVETEIRTVKHPDVFTFCCYGYDQIEPITDPGREVIAWSECVWKPEYLRTEA